MNCNYSVMNFDKHKMIKLDFPYIKNGHKTNTTKWLWWMVRLPPPPPKRDKLVLEQVCLVFYPQIG